MSKSRSTFRIISTLIATSFVFLAPSLASAQAQGSSCDELALEDAKQYFSDLKLQYRKDPSAVDEFEFRVAASEYIELAEQCYDAKFGSSPVGVSIDEGGMYMGPSGATSGQPPVSGDFESGNHVLWGGKWGAGSPFGPGTGSFPDLAGPRITGGTVTYSYMADGVVLDPEIGAALPNTAITSMASFTPCFLQEIELALGAWSAVADILFVPVTDGGGAFDAEPMADIRIGAHVFDGASGTLAHAFFPPPNGTFAAGDTHFDIAESWTCEPGAGAIDFGLVALHEFGHAIGLRHEAVDIAVMNAFYNPALTFGPLADDIVGAGEIYGSGGTATTTHFGPVGVNTDTPSATLEVTDSDGSAKILVTETSGVKTARDLFEIKNNGNPEFKMTNTGNSNSWSFSAGLRFVVKNDAGDYVSRIESDGDMEITGSLTTAGGTCGGGGCDMVFSPETKIESIEEHASQMWTNSYLPAVGPTKENEPFNLTQKTGGILNELEKAHIYIEQLHDRVAILEAEQERLATLEAEQAELKEMVRLMIAKSDKEMMLTSN